MYFTISFARDVLIPLRVFFLFFDVCVFVENASFQPSIAIQFSVVAIASFARALPF